MKQQINLYRPALNATTVSFPDFRSGIKLLLVLAVLMLLMLLWDLLTLARVNAELDTVYNEMRVTTTALQQLQTQRPTDLPVVRQIDELSRELQRLRQIKLLLVQQGAVKQGAVEQGFSGNMVGNREGFSGQLQGLSRQYRKGVSLTTITLLEGGRNVELAGFSTPPEQVPRYLDALLRDPAFANATFGELRMQRDPNTRQIAFQITRQEAQESP